MPLDIQMFREFQGGRPDLIRESQRKRFKPVEIVDEVIAKDEVWRKLTGQIDDMRKRRNKIQKEEVASKMKAGLKCDLELAMIKKIDEEIVEAETLQKNVKVEVDALVNKIGNIVDSAVPVSQDEDKDNAVLRTWGKPRDPAGLLNHHDLLWRIGGYEPERGVNVAGHKGYFLRDAGVLLNQALINYGIAFLRKRNYSIVQPPFFMKKEVMAGVAQLEEFDEALYKVSGENGDEKYLIATSEQPLCGYHMDDWIEEKSLPIRYSGISTCFRKEAGSSGKDVWGIFRVHQFEKVEQFVIVDGDLETSKRMQEEMILAAEEFYQSLGFPYQVINIVSGALNNAAIKKYDLECWFPGYNSYRELVSCSNCTDYQSRAMSIRCGIKKMNEREKKYVHMLNSTLCATGRAICCLLETYQDINNNGVHIPEVLVPFMGGITFLPFIRDSKLVVEKPLATTTAAVTTAASAPTTTTTVEKKEQAAAIVSAPTPAPATTTATTEELPANVKAVVEKIAAKGDEIRQLKANKAAKEVVLAQVEQLKALKNEFKDITGKEYDAPAPATTTTTTTTAAKEEKKPKEEKKAKEEKKPKERKKADETTTTTTTVAAVKEEKKPVAAPAPAVPAASVPKTTVTSTAATTPAAVPTVASLVNGKEVNLLLLNERLRSYSYVAGFTPSKEDARLYDLLLSTGKLESISSLTHANRWWRQISSYQPSQRTAWK